MAKKAKQFRKKRLFLAFFVTILLLAAFYKAGFFIYDYYFKKADTIVSLVPDSAYFYAHLNLDERKDPYKTLAKIVGQKSSLTAIQQKIQGLTEAFLQKFDINLANDWQPLASREMALAFLASDGKNYPLIIIQTNNPTDFEKKIISKIRKEQPLAVVEYTGYKTKNFRFSLAELFNHNKADLYLESTNFFYTTVEDKVFLSNNQSVINQTIDTIAEKSKSIKNKINSSFSNEFFYSYLKPASLNWDNQNWKIWQQSLAENKIEEIFIKTETTADNINIIVEDEKGIFDFNHNQISDTELFTYLPVDFKWAAWEKDMPNLTKYYQKKLNNFFSQNNQSTLSTILSLLPEEDLFNEVFSQSVLLATDKDGHYLLAARLDPNQTAPAWQLLESAIKKISSQTNPAERTVSYGDDEEAIELWPDASQVAITAEADLGQEFFSVPFLDQKIIYGLSGQFILISNAAELIRQSLSSDKENLTYQNWLHDCPKSGQPEIFISPLSNFSMPGLGQLGSDQELLAVFSNLEENDLSLNICLLIK